MLVMTAGRGELVVIENASTVKELNGLLARMHEYRVLDPACGSGNFLYVAMQQL